LLSQLVPAGERNFSRIVSSTAKYRLLPNASAPGEGKATLEEASNWLLIEPSVHQLPDAKSLRDYLRVGGSATILFAPEQAADPGIKSWLADLGLELSRQNSLSLSGNSGQAGLLSKRGAMLLRETRYATFALDTSLLKGYASDALIQTYTIRPTSFPRTTGFLSIGFSSDQFSDDAVGEVWEGIRPSSIGRQRERLLGSVLLGEERPPLFPEDLTVATGADSGSANLKRFIVLENGKKILEGALDSERPGDFAAIDPETRPLLWLSELRAETLAFIEDRCPKQDRLTQCDGRLLGPGLIEWAVTWTSNDYGSPIAVEVLHERRWSGQPYTWNIVYGD
jgi:hypothetical protein